MLVEILRELKEILQTPGGAAILPTLAALGMTAAVLWYIVPPLQSIPEEMRGISKRLDTFHQELIACINKDKVNQGVNYGQ